MPILRCSNQGPEKGKIYPSPDSWQEVGLGIELRTLVAS